MLFTLGEGKSRMFPDPQGRGFFIIRVDKIMAGNAMAAARADRSDAERAPAIRLQDYGQEFLAAIRKELGVKRNDAAIQSFRSRMVNSGG